MKRPLRPAKLLAWLLLAAIVGGAALVRWKASSKEDAKEVAIAAPVIVARPAMLPLARELRLNAYVESESMVTVLPLVSGILEGLDVDAGDRVRKGQVIARIDAERFRLQLGQAEAGWLAAKSSWERVEQLYKAGATSQQSYDQARAQFDAAKSQYELAKLQLQYASVTSPVDGVVLVRHLSAGAIAAPERPLVTIGDLSRLVVRARVPERYYAEFSARGADGRPSAVAVRVSQEGAGEHRAAISSVAPFVSAENKTFEVSCELGGDTSLLRPGMSVVAVFTLERREGQWSLPYSALIGGNTLWYAETAADGTATARSMALSPGFSTDERFAIPDSESGKTFIVEGQHFLREGSAVRVVGEAKTP